MNEIMIRLQNALNFPLINRCDEVRLLIRDCSYKELQAIFPILLESIFGFGNQPGWGLCTNGASYHPREYDALVTLLCCRGPMFELIYRLMSDCYLKYEFPLTLFPMNVRKSFEDDIPQYYLDKIQVDQQTRIVTSLALNPFEYYIFHFAIHLVNPWILRPGTPQQADSAYGTLVEDYLRSFLPCDGSMVQPPIDYYVVKSPLPRPQVVTTPVRTPIIFRPSMVSKANPPASLHSSPNTQTSPHLEIWRTETVIQAFTDMWLTYGENEINVFNCVRDLPSVDRIRMVRLLVKHFHFFANSANRDMGPMGEVKSLVRHVTRLKIYTFLRRTIQDWPLDGSFRVVLETWLSYIQPWRYTDYVRQIQSKTNEEMTRRVDPTWIDFIIENLFAYTVIFQQLIPRFARLDLTTPRNAHMLHRLTKVFAQPNLNVMIAEGEACLSEDIRWTTGMSNPVQPGLSPHRPGATIEEVVRRSPTVAANGPKWKALLRQLLQELEGPHYIYTFLFDNSSEKVNDILQMILEAAIAARVLLKGEEQLKQKRPASHSFTSMIRDFFLCPPETNQYSVEERRKVVCYLDLSMECLAQFFMVTPPPIPDVSNMSLQDISSLMRPDGTTFYQLISNNMFATENQRTLQGLRFRRPPVCYEGDPDLQPVRSTELSILVWLFHNIAVKINERHGDKMAILYCRDDFMGRLTRQILCPPMVIRVYDKKANTRFAPLVEKTLPPRLSLRPLASIKRIVYCGIIFFTYWLFMDNPFFILFYVFGLWLTWIFMKALCEPLMNRPASDPTPPRANVSDVNDPDLSASF